MISWWECLPSGFIGAYGALLAPVVLSPIVGRSAGILVAFLRRLCYYGSLIVVNERCGVR